MKVRLDRRTVLRGLGGVAVGLPVLECMLNSNGDALAQAAAAAQALRALCSRVKRWAAMTGPTTARSSLGKRSTDASAFIAPPETGRGLHGDHCRSSRSPISS